VSQGFRWGFGKTLPFEFGFGGTKSTIAKKRGGSIWGLHLWFFFSLEVQ